MNKAIMKFIVAAPKFNDASGGVIVLHHLANRLAELGFESVIASSDTFPENKAKLVQWEFGEENYTIADKDSMVIYPEVISDNPLNAWHVTRWILYKEGGLAQPINYGANDLVYQFGAFHRPLNRQADGMLTITFWDHQFLVNQKLKRTGVGFIVRKGAHKKPHSILHRKHPPRSIFLDGECKKGVAHMHRVFNRLKVLISYDSETGWALQAAATGCLVVIVPTKGITKQQFWRDFPTFKFGIAYGFFDIPRALITRKHLMAAILNDEAENEKSVRKYTVDIANYFKRCESIE